jgi:hypothetical protein
VEAVIAYKFLRADGSSVFSGFDWPLPSGGAGAWVAAPPDPCRSGIHACGPADLPFWPGRALYEIELDGAVVEQQMKVIAPRDRRRAEPRELHQRVSRDERRGADQPGQVPNAAQQQGQWRMLFRLLLRGSTTRAPRAASSLRQVPRSTRVPRWWASWRQPC